MPSVSSLRFYDDLKLAFSLARHWGVLVIPPDKNVKVVNWRIENDRVVGDPGFVLFEPGDGELGIEGNTFIDSTLTGIVDNVISLVNIHREG